jgi:hypothetical protein
MSSQWPRTSATSQRPTSATFNVLEVEFGSCGQAACGTPVVSEGWSVRHVVFLLREFLGQLCEMPA